MNSAVYFADHTVDHLARQLKISPKQSAALINYIAAVGCTSTKEAVKIARSAGSPSAKKIIEVLKLDSEAEENDTPQKSDEFDIKQHDYRAITTHSPQNQPYSSGYSLFSIPSGEQSPQQ